MTLDELKQTIARLEKTIGTFSTAFWSMDEHGTVKRSQEIRFEQKPAQQFLSGLGGSNKSNQALSIQLKNTSQPYQVAINNEVVVKGFDFRAKSNANEATTNFGLKLTIVAARIEELVNSAKIYINTILFPKGLYAKSLALVKPQESSISEEAGIHWQNLAVGVCHAQKIDLLVHSSLGHEELFSKEKTSRTTLKVGEVNPGDAAILLLSSPLLKYDGLLEKGFTTGYAQKLTQKQQIQFIEGMYRNLFHATLNEKYQCIALPPVDCSSKVLHMYLNALMNVAKEYPDLAILCHPGIHQNELDQAIQQHEVHNIIKVTKDIVVVADRLVQEGILCALHNPSDVDVIYGHSDVGATWKTGKNKHFNLEQYIASISTAPINSKGFNPRIYENIIERDLINPMQQPVAEPEEVAPCNSGDKHKMVHAEGKNREPEPEIGSPVKDNPLQAIVDDTKTPLPNEEVPTTMHDANVQTSPFIAFAKRLSPMLTPARLFQAAATEKDKKNLLSSTSTSSFNEEQLADIRKTIDQLDNEIKSCWPYPNKHLKQTKINALVYLVAEAETKSVEAAIKSVKKEYPRATDGLISTRTADLFERLLRKNPLELQAL